MKNIEALKTSSHVLGCLFYYNPASTELEDLRNLLLHSNSVIEWPYGNKDELEEIYKLFNNGLQDVNALDEEYKKLFEGPNKLYAPPWGSVYLDRDAVIFGESTIKLREWLHSICVEPVLNQKESEDHIGLMLMLLSYIVSNKENKTIEYMQEHLYTWCYRCLECLENATNNNFYTGLCRLTRLTFDEWKSDYNIVCNTVKYYF